MDNNHIYDADKLSTMSEIINDAKNGRKISLIKRYRAVTNYGLKDSKDAIEACQVYSATSGNQEYDLEKLVALFEAQGMKRHSVTKEQFMKILEKAIDGGDELYCEDMLEAVATLCHNLKKKGGLRYIELRRELFINKL